MKQLNAEAGDYIEKKLITHVLNMTGGNKAKVLNIRYKALFIR